MAIDKTTPKTFFLNEKQELTRIDRQGGGRPADYIAINWTSRSKSLAASFLAAVAPPIRAVDPTLQNHRFIIAEPVPYIEKRTTAKTIPSGVKQEEPSFGGRQSTLFKKIGMDLIETSPNGRASVHIPATRVPQIQHAIESLPNASTRERTRWIAFERFSPPDWQTRVSSEWIESLPHSAWQDTYIRFQPPLRRDEAINVLTTIQSILRVPRECFVSFGREFSGRHWCLARFTPQIILDIATHFASIQSLHEPLRSMCMPRRKKRQTRAVQAPQQVLKPRRQQSPPTTTPIPDLPTVAVLDCGIPENHTHLGPYRRPGYRDPDIDPTIHYMGDHGSRVASCVVFGNLAMTGQIIQPSRGTCRVLDVMIGASEIHVNDERVVDSMGTVASTAPDVRVFNLSFDSALPLDLMNEIERRERLTRLQDADNFAFARDALLVVASGNSAPGISPDQPYPRHIDDPRWKLGSWARTFNGAVCGAYIDKLSSNGLAGVCGKIGAPSPFTRTGPGICDSPVPGFSAPGGDCTPSYQMAPGAGPWMTSASGLWEDHSGTSYSAPFIAREAAWVFSELAKRCNGQTVPFAGTVKAWLNLVAWRTPLGGSFEQLAKVTLGNGYPTANRLWSPLPESSVFIWQTVLESPENASRVQLPIPLVWLRTAKAPRLRVVCSWNTPVNRALTGSWACRKVNIKIRPFGSNEALRGGGNAKGAYPLIDRNCDISINKLTSKNFVPSETPWVIEVDYNEIGEYPPAMTVSPQQRVGLVFEIFDDDEQPVSPQSAIQSLPFAADLVRLSVLHHPIKAPITIQN